MTHTSIIVQPKAYTSRARMKRASKSLGSKYSGASHLVEPCEIVPELQQALDSAATTRAKPKSASRHRKSSATSIFAYALNHQRSSDEKLSKIIHREYPRVQWVDPRCAGKLCLELRRLSVDDC